MFVLASQPTHSSPYRIPLIVTPAVYFTSGLAGRVLKGPTVCLLALGLMEGSRPLIGPAVRAPVCTAFRSLSALGRRSARVHVVSLSD